MKLQTRRSKPFIIRVMLVFRFFHRQLVLLFSRPLRMTALCVAIVVLSILTDGTLYRLWVLKNSKKEIQSRIESGRKGLVDLRQKMESVQRIEYIERQAHDRLELVQDGDLIFVFADNESSAQ